MTNYGIALDRAFHALADPHRRDMVARLCRGPATVKDLAAPLPIGLPTVLQHLAKLQASGLVRTEKTGRVRTCRLEPAALELAEEWIAGRRSLWSRRFDRLQEVLDDPNWSPPQGEQND